MWKPRAPAPAKRGVLVAVKLSVLNWRFGGSYVSFDVRPRSADKMQPASKVGTVANVLGRAGGKAARSSAAPTPRDDVCSPEERAAHKRQWDSEQSTPAPRDDVCSPEARAAHKRQWDSEQSTPATAVQSPPLNPYRAYSCPPHPLPSLTRRPSKYSATIRRLAHCSNDAGEPQPKQPKSFGPSPALLGCTWSEDCKKCAEIPDGQLAALRCQIADAKACGRDTSDACTAVVVWSGASIAMPPHSTHHRRLTHPRPTPPVEAEALYWAWPLCIPFDADDTPPTPTPPTPPHPTPT